MVIHPLEHRLLEIPHPPRIARRPAFNEQKLLVRAHRHDGVGVDAADELRELLGLPPDALTMALIPMGYPARGRWAEPKRRPVEEVVHWNRWGETRGRP